MHQQRPSRTALAVALSTLYQLCRDPGCSLNPPGSAALLASGFARMGGLVGLLSRAAMAPALRPIIGWSERAFLPGIFAHYLLRKHFIEHSVRALLADPRAQLVVLGAGFDTLASRLAAACPSNLVIELDHPATQSAKRTFLEQTGSSRGPLLVACDLQIERPSKVLHAIARFDNTLPTIFVLEGLTMYFTPSQVHALWTDLAQTTTGHAAMLCTFMEPGPRGIAHFPRQTRIMRAWLRLVREPFAWGCSLNAMNAALSGSGWQQERLFGPGDFATSSHQLSPRDARHQPIGEYIVHATRPTISTPI